LFKLKLHTFAEISQPIMKKISVLLLFVLSATFFCSAQNLKIIRPHYTNNVLNDSTVIHYGNSVNEMVDSISVINSTNSSISILVKRDTAVWNPATVNSFCWGINCFAPGVSITPFSDRQNVSSGDTLKGVNGLFADYSAYGYVGITAIRYVFYDASNPSDSAWIIVDFDALPSGIPAVSGNVTIISAPYPNPSNTSVNFTYRLSNSSQSANLKIFNMLGESIQTIPISSSTNKVSINVQSIPSGIYVCEIQTEGSKPVYQKMIVSH